MPKNTDSAPPATSRTITQSNLGKSNSSYLAVLRSYLRKLGRDVLKGSNSLSGNPILERIYFLLLLCLFVLCLLPFLLIIMTVLIVPDVLNKISTRVKFLIWVNQLWSWRQLGSISHRLRWNRLAAVSFIKCANLLEERKRLDEAGKFFDEAVRCLVSTHHLPHKARSVDYKNFPKQQRGELPRVAPAFFQTTNKSARRLYKEKYLHECICLDRAAVYLRQNNPEPAGELLDALKHAESSIESALLGRIAATRAEYYRVVNLLPEARKEIDRALAALKFSGTKRDLWLAQLIAGFIYLENGAFEAAHRLLRTAKDGFEKLGEVESLAKAYLGLGRIQLEKSNYKGSLELYQTARRIAEQTQLSLNLQWKIFWGLGYLSGKLGQQEEAVQYLEQAVKAAEQSKSNFSSDSSKIQYSENAAPMLDDLIKRYADLGQNNASFYEECRFLIEATRGSSLREMLLHRERSEIIFYKEGETPQVRRGGNYREVKMANDQSWETELNKNYIRIIYHLLKDRLVILLKRVNQPTIGTSAPIDTQELVENLKAIGNSFGISRGRSGVTVRGVGFDEDNSSVDHEQLLQKLYQLVWQPIAGYLPQNSNFYLLLEPHRLLWAIPFASLRSPDGDYLCDRYPVVLTPSYQLNRTIRKEARLKNVGSASALIIGNPDYANLSVGSDNNSERLFFNSLPGAEAEALAIANFFPEDRRNLLLNSNATEGAFLEEANKHNIIHLATHGYSDEYQPEKSFLAFTKKDSEDGLLRPNEILRLRLVADLVVLSACQTGLGKITGEGVVGLSRSFLIAGARSVLVSLWRIDDVATAEIMQHFYRFYHSGQTKAEALRNAMLEMKKQENYVHPRFWSGFYLVGADK